jgi:hypothetical protein
VSGLQAAHSTGLHLVQVLLLSFIMIGKVERASGVIYDLTGARGSPWFITGEFQTGIW